MAAGSPSRTFRIRWRKAHLLGRFGRVQDTDHRHQVLAAHCPLWQTAGWPPACGVSFAAVSSQV